MGWRVNACRLQARRPRFQVGAESGGQVGMLGQNIMFLPGIGLQVEDLVKD